MGSLKMNTAVPPLSGGNIQNPQWMPETVDIPNPTYIMFFFSCTYLPLIKFNL